MIKNIIVVTGGAGFIGSNLIELLLKKNNLKIISLDNYSCGTKKNHIRDKRVSYLNGDTKNINKILQKKKKNLFIQFFTLVNLLEFIRVFQK